MKVAIDARMITNTGIGRYIQNLLIHLPLMDVGNSFSAVTGTKGADFPSSLNMDVRLLRRDIPIYSLLKEQYGLPVEMNICNPDVLHYPNFNMPLYNPKPSVVTIHDLIYYLVPQSCSQLRRLYARLFFPLTARAAVRIITGSEHTKGDIVNHLGVDPSKVTVIHHGVSPAYKPVTDDAVIRQAKLRYGIDGDYILYVGTHHPRKNLKRLIEAFSKIKIKGIRLVITGAIEARRQELYEAPRRLGVDERVIFTGSVREDDLAAIYTGATIFCIPSLYEGFGLTPLEAMACGVPVISSDATSLPEVVGDAALTFDPLDIEAMTDCMDRLLCDSMLAAQLKKSGAARAKQFRWERSAEQTIAVYRAALAESS